LTAKASPEQIESAGFPDQASFKLKDKRSEGAKVIKRYHVPATPHERALTHPRLSKVVKRRLGGLYRTLDTVALLAEKETPRRSSARASRPDRAGSETHENAVNARSAPR
jgi:hypothetical protein